MTFQELYRRTLREAAKGATGTELREHSENTRQIDCLLYPDRSSLSGFQSCDCTEDEKEACIDSCFFDALRRDKEKRYRG